MKLYRYTVSHSVEGSLVLTYAPVEWASDAAFWERSMTYWGVFRSFSTKELSFIKNGATWLKNIFDTYGTEAEVTYQVEAFNPTTYAYDVIYTGVLDFTTYKLEDRGRYDVVKLQVIDDSFTNTVKTREGIEVNLAKLYDLEGNAITPFTNEGRTVRCPTRIDTYYTSYSKNATLLHAFSHVPMIEYSSREDASSVNPTSTVAISAIAGAFFTPTYNSNLTVSLVMTGTLNTTAAEVVTVELRRYNSAGVLQSTTTIATYTGTGSAHAFIINIDDDYTINSCVDGDYVILAMIVQYATAGTNVTYDIAMDISYTRTVLTYFDFTGYPYHEVFTRVLQAITGDANPFYSTLLGRTNSEITTYTINGAMADGVVTNGLLIRGFSLTDPDVALSVSLKQMFDSLSAIHPMCLGVETISGTKVVRIEDIRHAFDSHYFLTIENCSEITEEVAIDLSFSSLSLGFSKSEVSYNEVKGRYEYNTNAKYATFLKRNQNEFSRVAPYRADGNAIIYARQQAVSTENATENTPYDESIFLISTYGTTSLTVKEDEGYSVIGNVDNPEHSYNLDYAPGRALRRWGSFLRGCLEKYTTSIISFLKSDKNATMYSQLSTEITPVYEGADVDVSDLNDPFFENIYYNFECVVNNGIISLLNSVIDSKPAPYYIVRFRGNETESYKYGWIMKVEALKEGNKGKGSIRLLKVNTTYITPTSTITSYTADSTVLTVDNDIITVDNGTI